MWGGNMRRRNVLLGRTGRGRPHRARNSPGDAQTKTLTIGGSVPLTGAAAETGLNVNNGYVTAATYINDVLGGVEIAGDKYKIQLKLFDDASDPARATTLIQRQIDEGTDFFLGSFGSNIVLPTVAITERAKKPMVQTGGGSDAIFTRGYKYLFGMFPRATRQFASAVGAVQDAAAGARRPIRSSTTTTPSPRPRPRACSSRATRRASSGSTTSSCRPR